MVVKASDGRVLTRDSFQSYSDPLNLCITDDVATEVLWSKNMAEGGVRFFVHNAYHRSGFSSKWGATFSSGLFIQAAAFLLAIPATMNPRFLLDNVWKPLSGGLESPRLPDAICWQEGGKRLLVRLNQEHSGMIKRMVVRSIPTVEGSPGGTNSFCPFPLLQVRLEVELTSRTDRIALDSAFVPEG